MIDGSKPTFTKYDSDNEQIRRIRKNVNLLTFGKLNPYQTVVTNFRTT